MFDSTRLPFSLLLAFFLPFTAALISGCASSANSSSALAGFIAYEDVDRRQFVDAGVHVRTAHGNRVSVEVAENDTLVWFENEETGRFTRAFLRRGNTIYMLTRESNYFRGSPSQTVAYRLFMEAWREANRTGTTVTSSFADDQQ
jgi:hypothetical protein